MAHSENGPGGAFGGERDLSDLPGHPSEPNRDSMEEHDELSQLHRLLEAPERLIEQYRALPPLARARFTAALWPFLEGIDAWDFPGDDIGLKGRVVERGGDNIFQVYPEVFLSRYRRGRSFSLPDSYRLETPSTFMDRELEYHDQVSWLIRRYSDSIRKHGDNSLAHLLPSETALEALENAGVETIAGLQVLLKDSHRFDQILTLKADDLADNVQDVVIDPKDQQNLKLRAAESLKQEITTKLAAWEMLPSTQSQSR